jgi:hypothetical protein
MIEACLDRHYGGAPLVLPHRLAAIQLAEAQLALIENWLRGCAFARIKDVAAALHQTSRAAAAALAQAGVGDRIT